MSLSSPFINRPVATSLIMVALLLAGFVAYKLLPVSALPQVDYPTIQVVAFYPGASPEVMASSVTAPVRTSVGRNGRPNSNDFHQFKWIDEHYPTI